jgi:hypothetical protein
MKLLDKKYYNLEPKFECLKDSFILGLAWKKTDSFVRTHNWYADLLALDKCALDISDEVINWSNEVKNCALSKSDIELIPAPKGANWFFHKQKWTTNKDDRKLRPLANISIKDQSFATVVTMCLADAIETRQKDCSLNNLDYAEHVKNKVVSYGNRLICDWDNEKARFRWGGSEYYRKYSVDYRNFLQRPLYIGRETVSKISGIDDVYIVSLDLKNFFGSININILLEKLKKIASKHYGSKLTNDNRFWSFASQILTWKWPEESLSLLESLDLKNENVGLPQGLASAGALANAYLIEFDESLTSKLHTKIEDNQIILHDYCRYVDDIRLVVSGEALTNEMIKESIHELIQGVLDETLEQDESKNALYLKINDRKTYIFELSDIDNGSGLTNRINEIQHEVGASSIPERNGLDNNIPALQQLLLTEQDNFLDDADDLFPGFNNDKSIKVGSLRRFSAHRLETSLAKKSKIISPAERKQFDNESALIAKKLLKAWLKDPSIMVIFRKAIAINPNLDAYNTILKIIFSRIQHNNDKRDKYIMLYLLSDIFRSVVDIYRNLPTEYITDYQKLMSEVTSFAQKLLSCKSFIPSYACQQALLYLAVINKPFIASKKASSDLARLQSVLIKQYLEPLNSSDGYLFELSAQISKDYQANAAFLLSHTKNNKVVDSIIKKFAFRGGEFWNAIWREIARMQDKERINKFKWAIPKYESKPNGSEHYLSSVISFEDNPFKYEHALLKLGIALVNLFDDPERKVWQPDGKQYSPHEINVKIGGNFTSWSELWHPNVNISCSIDKIGKKAKDPRYKSPDWLVNDKQSPNNDEKKLYWVCSVLRSAALGHVDYTQRNDLKLDRAKYDGIHSQFYKRRMGMLHTPESIVGSYGTITDWFASFLQHGLQWPGFSSSYINQEDILSITSLSDFKKCLSERLGYLNTQICTSSNVPTLPTVVSRPELASNHFRIVTVQQLFPKDKNFHPSDVRLDNPDVRWKHREHLAEICKLTEQTLNAKLKTESRDYTSTADLIVFSELAVHPEDEDIVRALAFRTRSIIFCGFVFCEQDGRIVNKARWIIPDSSESGTQWRVRDQGKYHMTSSEVSLGVHGYRPSQHIISIEGHPEGPFKLTGAICYDATDIKLAADLRDLTDMFVIAAYNKDVDTFDNMASALQWHMYQHVVITNTGEYGGSTMQAPYKEKHHKLISHAHGTGQIAISTADIDLAAFRRKIKEYKKTKAQPAGFNRKH